MLNYFYNNHNIPYKNRKKFYLWDIEIISFYIHDYLPYNYNEQGIWAGDQDSTFTFTHLIHFFLLPTKMEGRCWWRYNY